MKIVRTDQGELDKIVAAPIEQGVATPLRSASVSGGQTRFNGQHSLIVNGSEDVFGTLNVQGTLNADGTVNLTTTINITGSLTVSGPSGFIGQETHIGEESHQGNITNIGTTTQRGDLNVTGGGKINVDGAGNMVLGVSPSTGRASVHFAGGELSSDGDQVALTAGGNFAGVGGGNSILGVGSNAVVVNSTGTHIYGPVYMHDLPTKPASTGGGGGVIDV